jgi:AcrR family transcriptional regulator
MTPASEATNRRRKEQRRKQRTRERLLSAAAQVFVRQGYHRTLISDIVAQAGVGQGTFYRYFTNKREIVQVLFDRLVQALFASLEPMATGPLTSLEEYRDASIEAAQQVISSLAEHREVALFFIRDATSIDSEFEARLSGVYDEFAALAQRYLDHAIERGFARPCRSDLVSQALVGMALRMITLSATDGPAKLPADEFAREIVDFAFIGFAKR